LGFGICAICNQITIQENRSFSNEQGFKNESLTVSSLGNNYSYNNTNGAIGNPPTGVVPF